MALTNLLTALAIFLLGNLVTYGIYEGLAITTISPGVLSILIQIGLALILYLFGASIPYLTEMILAEVIVIASYKVLDYLTGVTIS